MTVLTIVVATGAGWRMLQAIEGALAGQGRAIRALGFELLGE
ncbi:MAG: hypothetical protein OET79_15275 [Nitrospirota bacterium]|nr:hypothetical protein [Nitrospirota bacterium]